MDATTAEIIARYESARDAYSVADLANINAPGRYCDKNKGPLYRKAMAALTEFRDAARAAEIAGLVLVPGSGWEFRPELAATWRRRLAA